MKSLQAAMHEKLQGLMYNVGKEEEEEEGV